MSAAHCFFRELSSSATESVALEDLSLFQVAVGKFYRNLTATEEFPSQFLKIDEIISVPGYDGYMGFFSADFALVVVGDFIRFRPHVSPICLDKDNSLVEETEVAGGLSGIVAGWGFTKAGSDPSEFLKIATLSTVNYNKCKREAPQNFKHFVTPGDSERRILRVACCQFHLISDKFCAGNLGGGDAVCQGDSGSGLAFSSNVNNEEVFTLRGIVSNARQIEGECDLDFYTMFTNLDHYMRFIKSAEKRFPST